MSTEGRAVAQSNDDPSPQAALRRGPRRQRARAFHPVSADRAPLDLAELVGQLALAHARLERVPQARVGRHEPLALEERAGERRA